MAVTAAAEPRHRVGRCVRCWVSRVGVKYERGAEPCQAMPPAAAGELKARGAI